MRFLIFLVLLLAASHTNAQQEKPGISTSSSIDTNDWRPIFDPKDTYAQWFMAFLSAVAIGPSIWAVVLVNRSLKLTRDATDAAVSANEIAREQFASDQRPWIRFVDDPILDHYVDRSGAGAIVAKVSVKNTGKSPAVDVTAHLQLGKMPLMLTSEGTKKFAESVSVDNKWATDAVVVFSEDETPTQVSGFSNLIPEGANDIKLILCVTYKASGMNKIYYTAIAVKFNAIAIETTDDGISIMPIKSKVIDRSVAMI